MPDGQPLPVSFGPNAWLVDEMYDQYVQDPNSVSESWREFFEDYRPARGNGSGPARQPEAPAAEAAQPPSPDGAAEPQAKPSNGQQRAATQSEAAKPASKALPAPEA